METNASTPSVPIEKPIWKRPWFWVVAASVMGFLFLVGIALAATLVVPSVLQRYQMAARKKVQVNILAIENALTEYALVNGGKFPESLEALVTPDANGRTFLGGSGVPKDPWGRAYEYDAPGPGSPLPRVRTLGRDGRLGGEGVDTDIDGSSDHP